MTGAAPAEATSQERAVVDRYIQEEANAAIQRGARYLGLFGFGSAVVVSGLIATGLLRNVELAAAFALVGGLYSSLLYATARRGRLRGGVVYAFLLAFVSFPSLFFLASHAVLPLGAGTFMTGPYSFLYFPIIVATGFFFDARLSRVIGLVAGAEYLGCYLLGYRLMAGLPIADPTFRQEVASIPIYALKATVMGLAGFVVGALARTARSLILKALHEEREKQGLSRLFGQYVSPEVREKVLREKSGMVGERKQVAVLFADLRGFTRYSEEADPADLVRHLNEYLDAMVHGISDHSGVIDKFIGDAVMAVFGGVLELERPAEAALDAALELRARLKTLNEDWIRRGLPALDNGIGIHFGEVLQGTIGSEDRKEFTVIGDTVNTAARLEAATREHPFPILVSRALVEALPEPRRAGCVALGGVKLKGKQQEVEVFGVGA